MTWERRPRSQSTHLTARSTSCSIKPSWILFDIMALYAPLVFVVGSRRLNNIFSYSNCSWVERCPISYNGLTTGNWEVLDCVVSSWVAGYDGPVLCKRHSKEGHPRGWVSNGQQRRRHEWVYYKPNQRPSSVCAWKLTVTPKDAKAQETRRSEREVVWWILRIPLSRDTLDYTKNNFPTRMIRLLRLGRHTCYYMRNNG